MKDNIVVQWIVLGLSVTAFQLLLKFAVTYLPQVGFAGSVRSVIASL